MQPLQFGSLYRLQFNPVGRTNHYMYMMNAAEYADQVAKEWTQKTGESAEAFMVGYASERNQYVPEGFLEVVSPEPGQHYDLFIATDDKQEATCSALMHGLLSADFSEDYKGFYNGQPAPGATRSQAGKDNPFYKDFISDRSAKAIDVDYEYHVWEEDLPVSDEEKAQGTRRYRPHHESSVKAWRVNDNPDNPFDLNR